MITQNHYVDANMKALEVNNDTLSLDSTPLKDMPTPPQDETDMFKYIDKIAYLILNNLPLRLKHLIKLRKLEEVSASFTCNSYLFYFFPFESFNINEPYNVISNFCILKFLD